jgi:hypothetical protein
MYELCVQSQARVLKEEKKYLRKCSVIVATTYVVCTSSCYKLPHPS